MTLALIDNSILSEYRTCNHVAIATQKIEFLESILKKFQISIDHALLTDRLYECFNDFQYAVLGFLQHLGNLDPMSEFGRAFKSRVRDKFRPISSPLTESSS